LAEEIKDNIIIKLSQKASEIEVTENSELALDWMNGRRTPDANQLLKGAIFGLNLGSDAPAIFRALVEATCFGAKKIVDRFNEQEIKVKGLIGLGGVAKKSPFIMQMMADVMDMPIRIHKSEQTCALGAAMFAATVAGIYPKVEDAMKAMGQGFDTEYHPNKEKVAIYAKRYIKYKEAGTFIESNLSS
jgi:L-ribulokinase